MEVEDLQLHEGIAGSLSFLADLSSEHSFLFVDVILEGKLAFAGLGTSIHALLQRLQTVLHRAAEVS